MTAVDPEFQAHYRAWIGFTRLIKYGLAVTVIVLILLAYFLL
jgi:hypothetical protein